MPLAEIGEHSNVTEADKLKITLKEQTIQGEHNLPEIFGTSRIFKRDFWILEYLCVNIFYI
jgi:hypothetical protein